MLKVFHNWWTDPWANGGPARWAPEYKSKYQHELQKRHGVIFFASGDWAHGWWALIDGALEQRALCALEALKELQVIARFVFRIASCSDCNGQLVLAP